MATAKTTAPDPATVYIDDRLRDGTATLQTLDLDALAVEPERFQARVKHIDINWVRVLAAERDKQDGAPLRPIVVFLAIVGAVWKYIVADGFHRIEEARNRAKTTGDHSIPAYVVKLDQDREDIERAALEYACMTNRIWGKGRTKEDEKRAVFLLLDDEVWWERSDTWIGTHVGLATSTVACHRNEYSVATGVALPENVKRRDRRTSPYKRIPLADRVARPHPRGEGRATSHEVSVGGSKISGTDREKVDAEFDARRAPRLALKDSGSFRDWLMRRGVLAKPVSVAGVSHGAAKLGFRSGETTFVILDWESNKTLWDPAGRALALKLYTGSPRPPVVVCYPEDGPAPLVELARRLGVEFLTPEELVERLKGEVRP